ncbi:DUF4367 domain-containing protein [Tissierella sp. Yu-01]|uniref:DUF4367 domain-containing protein n=1 Tax=Tissierella sp. Yu-01 TaxID=3035694 RepID=UPI00240D4EC6|nr:DUF4367 domain-containing protein [Tissierella sp. Yu-01]WFA10226.1 DUF4367 domain-containing protein [Tissierella sp. Yu-01]
MKGKTLTDEALDRLLYEFMPKANILLEQLEEERDKHIEPHTFSVNYKRKMKKIIKEYARIPVQRKYVTLRKFIAGFLILCILTNGLLIATAETYKEAFFNIITNIYEKFTSIVIEIERPSIEGLGFTQPSYIPDGFIIINEIETDITRKIDYMNGNKIIVFIQSVITSGEIQIDTEGAITEEMGIDNQIISYFFNKGIFTAYWTDNNFSYSINAEVSFEELVDIIEGIIKNKK